MALEQGLARVALVLGSRDRLSLMTLATRPLGGGAEIEADARGSDWLNSNVQDLK